MSLFSFGNDNLFLGLDIGDSSLKMVELKKQGGKIHLSNYAFSENTSEVNFTKLEDTAYLARAINKIRTDAGITGRKVVVSLPTFAVFSSIININLADKKALEATVTQEASKVIPLPLEEMILDWKVVPDKDGKIRNAGDLRIFLTGSPKKLVRKYVDIFKNAGLNLISLETETFSLVRSLIGDDKSNVMIVEIGANSTDLSIVSESIPVLNRSLAVCAATVTKALADNMGVSYAQAEQFKLDMSLSLKTDKTAAGEGVPDLVIRTLEPIVTEMRYMLDFFASQNNGATVEKVVLSGGGSLLLNLPEYLSKRLNLKVIVGDPWHRITYSEELRPVLSEVGPRLAVAIGLAMREIG